MNSLNFLSAEYLFQRVNRKKLFSILMRKIIKISHFELRQLDFLVDDYLRSELRREFNKQKNITSLEHIKEKFLEGEKILEDLENIIKIDDSVRKEKRFINNPIAGCNYLVIIKFYIFII